MLTPESTEVSAQRISQDPNLRVALGKLMINGEKFTEDQDINFTVGLAVLYGVSVETICDAALIAKSEIDQAILNGNVSLS